MGRWLNKEEDLVKSAEYQKVFSELLNFFSSRVFSTSEKKNNFEVLS